MHTVCLIPVSYTHLDVYKRQEGGSKYQLLNRMMAARKLGREEMFQEAARAYLEQEKLSEQIFRIME